MHWRFENYAAAVMRATVAHLRAFKPRARLGRLRLLLGLGLLVSYMLLACPGFIPGSARGRRAEEGRLGLLFQRARRAPISQRRDQTR